MTNKEKYINAFTEGLEIDASQVVGLKYQQIPEWDSVGHMSLIASIEEAFDIMMDTDDIIDFMAETVSSHMGQWNTNKRNSIVLPKPTTEAQQLVHLFDYFASRKTCELHFEDVAPIKKETIETFKFTFGKHNGEMLTTVLEKDPSYVEWLKENYHKEPLRTLLTKV